MGNIYKFSTRIKRKKCMNSHELGQLYFVLCRKKECKVIIDKSEKTNEQQHKYTVRRNTIRHGKVRFILLHKKIMAFIHFVQLVDSTTHTSAETPLHLHQNLRRRCKVCLYTTVWKEKKSYVNTEWFLYPFSNTWSTLAGLMGLVKYLATTSKPCSVNQMVLLGQPWLQ